MISLFDLWQWPVFTALERYSILNLGLCMILGLARHSKCI